MNLSMEETNDLERVYHSYDEWLAGELPWGVWSWNYGERGVLHEDENVTKIHVLPESEYRKIVSKQEEILADHVEKNLAVYIQKFDERLNAPGEWEERIEDETQEVNGILTDRALTHVPIFYNEGKAFANGSVDRSPDLGRHVTPDFKNEIAYWYYKIIIRADPENEPRIFMLPEDAGVYSRYIPQVVVLVLYQYRQYLLNLVGFDIDRFTFEDSNPPPGQIHIPLCCIHTDKIFEGLRKYKPSREEFFMFKDSFQSHPFASYARLQNELPKVIDEIFERAMHLRSDVQAYFLESMLKDVVREIGDNETLINEKFKFQKMFKERLVSIQKADEKRFQEVDGVKPTASDEEVGMGEPGFTTAQAVLAIFHLLKAANFDRSKATDVQIAQFIQLITGKEANTKPKDTSILKKWRVVVDERKPLNRKDLETVQSWFEKIGLDEIAETIGKRTKKRTNNKE